MCKTIIIVFKRFILNAIITSNEQQFSVLIQKTRTNELIFQLYRVFTANEFWYLSYI